MQDVTVAWLKSPYFTIDERFKETGYTKPKEQDVPPNLITLIDAICDAYDNQAFIPTDGVTHCNEGVNYVAEAMGCKDFSGKTADEIVNYLSSAPDWSLVPIEKVQELANKGSLVIAGLDSATLGQSHGHVAVVRPGKQVYSGKWGVAPRILNIGAENFIARAKKGPLTNQPCGLNEAFVPLPKIWVWRPTL